MDGGSFAFDIGFGFDDGDFWFGVMNDFGNVVGAGCFSAVCKRFAEIAEYIARFTFGGGGGGVAESGGDEVLIFGGEKVSADEEADQGENR